MHPAQALHGIDFPAVIEHAYRDGVRVFLEMGPGIVLHAHDRRHPRRPAAPGAVGVRRGADARCDDPALARQLSADACR